jgi:eukaryotic-like serine/threonine-protein kinase
MTTGDETPRTFGDRYVLGDRITTGDDREVWLAHDDVISRQVVLKIFFGPRTADSAWRKAFRRDAKRLAALSHPGIAKTYEYAESESEAWLAMAFAGGEALSTRIGNDPAIAAAQALDVVGQTALAVQAAHDVGLAHGALSAANLLVRDDGVVAVIGFALASEATQTTQSRPRTLPTSGGPRSRSPRRSVANT